MIRLSRRARSGMVRGKQPLWQRRSALAWDAFRADMRRRFAADAEYRSPFLYPVSTAKPSGEAGSSR